MAAVQLIFTAFLFACVKAQMPIQGFFNVPGTAFNRGGRVDFQGLSLGQVCKQIMMMGGKEALSDGMGMAAKWFANQRINSQIAGGADPQMQCLYSQATGAMMPGAMGATDPGNMFGDYFDTVIEYPMILDPCTAPQCNGKVNPTVLLMQTFAPMMRMGALGGGMGASLGGAMGGGLGAAMGGALGNGLGAALGGALGGNPGTGAAANPFSVLGQNPFLSAMMPQQPSVPTSASPVNGTQPSAPTPQFPNGNPMTNMFQNPQMLQMMQQLLSQMFPRNSGPAAPSPNFGAAGFPGFL